MQTISNKKSRNVSKFLFQLHVLQITRTCFAAAAAAAAASAVVEALVVQHVLFSVRGGRRGEEGGQVGEGGD